MIIITIGFSSSIGYFVQSNSWNDFTNDESTDQLPKSKYIIENLKGYSLGTHYYWKIIADETLYVNIKSDANLPAEKLEIVKDAILSMKSLEIDENKFGNAPEGTISKYYLGWQGALSNIKFETENEIPKKFDVKSTGNSAGDIIITLTNMKNGDGLAGITKSIAYGDQIIKSEITIYDASSLTDRELEQISRHEFGHALGLAHTNLPEDLMNPQIHTPFPYISKCNINGIIGLYDGKTNDKVVCVGK